MAGKDYKGWQWDSTEPLSERAFRTWVHHRWNPWVPMRVEHSSGGTPGVADVLVQIPGLPRLLPVELKCGVRMTKENKGRIRPVFVRAQQILWHDELARHGGKSCLLIGVPQGVRGQWQYPAKFDAYVLADCRHAVLKEWRKGWPVEELTRVTGEDGVFDHAAWMACLGMTP